MSKREREQLGTLRKFVKASDRLPGAICWVGTAETAVMPNTAAVLVERGWLDCRHNGRRLVYLPTETGREALAQAEL